MKFLEAFKLKYYDIKIAGVDRKLPLCPLNEDLYIGAFVMFGDIELTVASAKALLEIAPEYDYIITAEAKGIPLAYEMAKQNNDETYFIARKVKKLYMTGVFEHTYRSITTAKEQTLYLDTEEANKINGKRILLVDDVISTGESLSALESLVEKAGGNIVGRMSVLAEGDAQERADITYLEKLPLFDKDGKVIE